jgi:amidase
VQAFAEDALGSHDAVALAEHVARSTTSPAALTQAAQRRAAAVADRLGAVAYQAAHPRRSPSPDSELDGVPTYLKDTTDIAGMPANHGTAAFTARPARKDSSYTRQFLATGMTVLGKSRMPEFGFSASTEFEAEPPAWSGSSPPVAATSTISRRAPCPSTSSPRVC